MATKNKPVMINNGTDCIEFDWNHIETNSDYIVETVDELKKWVVIYWGPKKRLLVKNLAPCTCYDFRIRTEPQSEWVYFKGATLEGPYLTMHLTRAIKFGKTSLIRKIAHSRPLLLEVENKEMKTPLNQAVEKNDSQLVNLLITLGANVNCVCSYTKRTLLMTAVSLGNLSIAQLLIDKGCKVNSTDINGLTILHHAVDSNNKESVEFALKHGVCVDSRDSNGWTPLMRAAILNCCDEIKNILLENGASKTLRDKNDITFEQHQEMAMKLVA